MADVYHIMNTRECEVTLSTDKYISFRYMTPSSTVFELLKISPMLEHITLESEVTGEGITMKRTAIPITDTQEYVVYQGSHNNFDIVLRCGLKIKNA